MQRRWVISPDYRSAIEVITAARVAAGISQRGLAERLGKHPSFVNKTENLERRLDILEFVAVAAAIGIDPAELMTSIVASLPVGFRL